MTINFLLEMEEKEYLIMRSVHTKIDELTTTEQNLNPNQIWISRQAPFTTLDPGATINDVIREEEDAESGIFCMSNVSTISLQIYKELEKCSSQHRNHHIAPSTLS